MSVDPLQGHREAINQGECDSLIWPDKGEGCPVKVGEVYALRSCAVEVTRVHRARKGRDWHWRAELKRIAREGKDKTFLARSGGMTEDPDQAMRAQDPEAPDSLGGGLPPHELRTDAQVAAGEPPEPEGVPAHEIKHYSGSKEARERYERDQAERRAHFSKQPVELRLLEIRRQAEARGVNVSRDLRVIEKRIEAIERQVLGEAA